MDLAAGRSHTRKVNLCIIQVVAVQESPLLVQTAKSAPT